DHDDHPWIAPGPTDVRSPCPGLNTLANHGYLPRSGKNISIPMMLQAAIGMSELENTFYLLDGFNIGSDSIIQAAKFGLLSGDAPTTLDLDALKLHNLIEHDASISRNDFAIGDNLHFNETIFSTLANANPGVDFYNASSAGQVQHDRLAISLATNPNITNTRKEFLLRTRESGLYLSLMGNPLTGVAPKQFVQIFFREERLPIAEGWRRPNVTITSETLVPMEEIIITTSNWNFTQLCEDLVIGPNLTI
ncbi:Cloroperoxidase, partial [Mycena pura]